MKNKKRNAIITCIVILLILIVGVILFFLNNSVVDTGLSVIEKKWVTDHTNQVVDVYVYNDIPIYGYNGSGINFDYLNYFTEKNNVSFNKISYYTTTSLDKMDFGFMLLNSNEEVGKNDILMATDTYAIMGLELQNKIYINEVHKLGVLEKDLELLKNYFPDTVEIIPYKDFSLMTEALKNHDIEYLCAPVMQYMSKELENNLSIVSHLTDLKNKLVLRVNDNTLYEIMRKSYIEYTSKKYKEDYSKNYLNVFFNSTHTDDEKQKKYNSKIYHYGYVINMPFENKIKDEFVGTLSNYLTTFENISFSDIEVVPYNTIDDLKSGLVSGEIDMALANFDFKNINLKYVTTNSIRNLDYVVISKKNININSIKGLQKHEVSVVGGSLLYYLCKNSGVNLKNYANTDELLRGLDDESIAIMDYETYHYYFNERLKDYTVILKDKIDNGYRFILNAENETFNKLFQYYISSIDYSIYAHKYNTDIGLYKDYTSIKLGLFMIALIVFLVVTVLFINRKNVTNVLPKKDEKLKYIDQLTSLKNRTYLDKNIYSWDDNVIFPQSIIVFNLNHIKRVNDKFGREAGDEIIKKVASILINQQLENTDIVRSDGNEFIIYMVGYEETTVKEYMRKLLKMMRDIPKCLGVEAGYSMIFDEVKTVDDAINEAIEMIMKRKDEEKKRV